MTTKLITVPVVAINMTEKLPETERKELLEAIENGYDITHSTAASIGNIMFVSYVLKKD